MNGRELYEFIVNKPVSTLIETYPLTSDFLANIRIGIVAQDIPLPQMLERVDETILQEFAITAAEIPVQLCKFLMTFTSDTTGEETISSLTIEGGQNKLGQDENISLTLYKGEVTAIVGPTGSGKSRLLGDIECLAQRDTPTRRLILLDGKELTDDQRFEMDGKLVAQLSQNMNFIMDLTAHEFLEMHARSRFSRDVETTVALCMTCANSLAGETFDASTKVTQLSGGQSRALMIADTAYMSHSPLVLIDEIENAGIDRKKAIQVLAKKDKIVLIATHDPLLALSADRRIVIQNGGIFKIIETTPQERQVLQEIERIDNMTQALRNKLRSGALIDHI